jgi:uncharacterized protein YggE
MNVTLTITRRTAVVLAATAVAAGGAVVVGLTGDSASPPANASVYAADTAPLAPDAFPGVTVTGTGKVTGTPDTLILDLAVSKTAGDVSTAMNQLSAAVTTVQAALKAGHVADADQKTSGLNVGPQYSYADNKQTVTGYQASENLTITLRDTKTAGAVIAAAAAAGGNATQIAGLSTDLQNDSALLSQARNAAFADAKAKADQYAKAAGKSIGGVVRIEETTTPASPTTPVYAPAAAAAGVANVPVSVGSTDLSVDVTVVFSFS